MRSPLAPILATPLLSVPLIPHTPSHPLTRDKDLGADDGIVPSKKATPS